MNKDIEKSLQCIFNTITAKTNEEVAALISQALQFIEKSDVKLDTPERFNCFINRKIKRVVGMVVKAISEPLGCKDKRKLNFIYVNYDFLEHNIRELCILREGSSCCADKSRYIIGMFLQYAIDGKIPDFDPNLEKYWIPNFGDNEMWIEYCNSLYSLYYGKTESYFNAYNNLLKSEIRKFKHLLHLWYMDLEDGTTVEVGHTWDNNLDCPLDDYDKGDYYIVRKSRINDNKFKEYCPEDEEEEFLYNNQFVKVDKSLVRSIYYKTEERMV